VTDTVVHHKWADIQPEQINPSISRRFFTADGVTIARFELTRGGIVPLHSHPNEQVSFVISGALLFRIGGGETKVSAGEVLQIPANVPHEVEVAEDAVVLDVFQPIRQDWLNGTDTYFKRT
jgi:quercetin dioxygenase-like cupin family protein